MTQDAPELTARRTLDHWVAQLSQDRDPLLSIDPADDAVLDIGHAHPSGLAMLLAGRPTRLSALVREPGALDGARRRARDIRARVSDGSAGPSRPAWLAVGTVSWDVPGRGRRVHAPVLLRPCHLVPRGAAGEDVELDLTGDVVVNPALLRELSSTHGVALDGPALAALTVAADGFAPAPALQVLAETVAPFGGRVDDALLVGTWSDAAATSAADLVTHRDELKNNALLMTFAGGSGPSGMSDVPGTSDDGRAAGRSGADVASGSSPEVESADLVVGSAAAVGPAVGPDAPGARPAHASRRTPSLAARAAYDVVDLDPEQRAAVDAVLSGEDLLLDAPAPTDWVSVVVAVVAAQAAQGRTTLVTGPARATDEVRRALTAAGLEGLAAHLEDPAVDRAAVLRQAVGALDRADRAGRAAREDARHHQDVAAAELDAHADALHRRRERWGVSAWQAQVALVELTGRRPAPRSRVRLAPSSLEQLDGAGRSEAVRTLAELVGSGALRQTPADDPWYGARLTTDAEVQRAVSLVTGLASDRIADVRERLAEVAEVAGRPAPRSVTEGAAVLDLVHAVRETLDVLRPEAFDAPLADLVAATADGQWRADHGVRMSAMTRRRLRAQARRLLRPGPAPADLHAVLVTAHAQRSQWQEASGPGSRPRVPEGLADLTDDLAELGRDLSWLGEALRGSEEGGDLLATHLDVLEERVRRLAAATGHLPQRPRVLAMLDRLDELGLRELVVDVAARGVTAADVAAELDLVWWASVLGAIAAEDPALGRHDGPALHAAAAELARLAPEVQAAAATGVRRAAAERLAAVALRHSGQADRVRAEAARSGTADALPTVVAQAPDVVLAALPVWVCPPLAVAGTLPPGTQVDLLVVVGADRLAAAHLAPALLRTGQALVVADLALSQDAESVATAARRLPSRPLTRDARSLDETLTAFARRVAYQAVVSLPGTPGRERVRLRQVDGTGMVDPDSQTVDSPAAEVDAVCALCLEHARHRDGDSLAVVALTRAHAARVEEALRLLAAGEPDLGRLVADPFEPLVVVAAEDAAGLVRDAAVITLGLGRTPHGRVLHAFGPAGLPGGELLLAAATTVARGRTTVVSSFAAVELDEERLRSPGARAVRDLLSWAASGGRSLEPYAAPGRGGLDPLLADLRSRLEAAGLVALVGPGHGVGGVEIAVSADGSPDGAWAAVLTDGPSYAVSSDAVLRDRLRPEWLAARGWALVRVWSTDVFRDPAREVSRVSEALRRANAALAAQRASGVTSTRGSIDLRGAAAGLGGWDGRQGVRPRLLIGRAVEDYSDPQLEALVAWLASDGVRRSDAELASLARTHLGGLPRSREVEAVLMSAVGRVTRVGTGG